jgi:hypothetical protein
MRHEICGPSAGDLRPSDLRRHVENLGFVVEETPEWFDPERGLFLAAEIVGSRRVLFNAPVVEKMKIQTIGSALAFKAGKPVETALRTALIAAIFAEVRRSIAEPPAGCVISAAAPRSKRAACKRRWDRGALVAAQAGTGDHMNSFDIRSSINDRVTFTAIP